MLAGFGQNGAAAPLQPGHDQDLFDPNIAASNLPNVDLGGMFGPNRSPRRQHRHQRQQQQQHQPPIMQNGNNLCYAVAAFHLLEFVKVN